MRRKHGPDSVGLSEETKRNIYFYHHSIEDHINSLAEQAGGKNFVAPIAAELVRLLEAKTLWEAFRSSQSLPEMRTQRNGDRTGGWPGSAPRGLAADVFSPASGHRPLSKKARNAISKAQRERWAKFHDKQAAERERWKKSSKARRERGAKQKPASYRKNRSAGIKSYWAKMTPEQRSVEMLRRQELSVKKNRGAA